MSTWLLFGLFAATLFGIACFHKKALPIAVVGLCCVVLARLTTTEFDLGAKLVHEAPTIVNLGGLLLGFALLANWFERSHLPQKLTEILPGGRWGAFLLLVLIAVMSSALDNIAAALIGGAAAMIVFKRNVHIGYIAAIVAASNAGGAGSVLGDTTTTMMWIDGIPAIEVAEAAIGALAAVAFCGYFAARQQHALQPLVKEAAGDKKHVDLACLGIVVLILGGAIATNFAIGFPAAGVWGAILIGTLLRKPDWSVMPGAVLGACFLLSLVLSASMMPVEELPQASPWSALGLGFVSAFFDNIPLTALAIDQGGYDWGYLAYCVGFGGSMLWFGSSAGVAISGLFPQARSAKDWLVNGWHVAVAYLLGFFTMLLILGWHVGTPSKSSLERSGGPGHEAHGQQGSEASPKPSQPGR